MSEALIRLRSSAFAVKTEVTPGVDVFGGGTPVAADFVGGDIQVQFQQNAIPNPETTASLDKAPGIAGSVRATLRLRVPLRGSGAAGTPPEWGKLMTACTMAETITASAVGAPTAAASGSTTSITLATPFVATADAYRGMPILLSGNVVDTTGILSYSAARVASLGNTLASAASASTSAQVPINVRYGPTSDESVYKTVTIYLFQDGYRWAFTGAMGTWSLELTTGGIGFLNFVMSAAPSTPTAGIYVPGAAMNISRPTAPRFVGQKMQLNRAKAQTRSMTIDAGVNIILPDDPEAAEGVGPALPSERAVAGTLDPFSNILSTHLRFDQFKSGTNVPLMAIIGSTAGNRFLVMIPSARQTQFGPGERDGLSVDAISFEADGADASVFLAAF